ncbi:NAC domain-containing protein 2 [Forsythia ovata]|uniref:NAC domain-containing protein 2 n=1 Tax=Forsythia ovata TaxID=205694 RepID=A0ABD1WY90_9LAMI
MKGGGDQNQQLEMPAGFRFHPTDEELVVHYLCRKCAGQPIDVPIITEIDLYKFNPWDLPDMALYGEKEWYFFSPRDRKYPNGSRPSRAAGTGYWKANGADKACGKAKATGNKEGSGTLEKHYSVDQKTLQFSDSEERKPRIDTFTYNGMVNPVVPPVQESQSLALQMTNDFLCCYTSESIPNLHDDSISSQHVLSPEFTCDKEVESAPKWSDFEKSINYQLNYTDGFQDYDFATQMQYDDQLSLFQDMLMYMQKPSDCGIKLI